MSFAVILPYGLNDNTIFHGKMPDGSTRDRVIFQEGTDFSQYTAEKFAEWYNNIISELLAAPDGSIWIEVIQDYISNNPVHLAITEGPYKVVQPTISVQDLLKLKNYIAWNTAKAVLKVKENLKDLAELNSLAFTDDLGAYGPGGVKLNFLYLFLSKIDSDLAGRVNVWLNASGQETRQKYYFLLYGADIADSYGFFLSNEKKLEHRRNANSLFFASLKNFYNRSVSEIDKLTADKLARVLGPRGGSNPTQDKIQRITAPANSVPENKPKFKSLVENKKRIFFIVGALIFLIVIIYFLFGHDK